MLLTGLLVALVGVGCSAAPASAPPAETPSASPAASPAGPLLTVGYRGGHCLAGSCDRTIAIEWDGRVHVTEPEPQELGTLTPALLQDVQEQLSVADFQRLGSRPFTGTCPIAFDGQELIYTFYGATGEIRLESCKVELDPADPLFVAIDNAIASVQPQ
jgi:hypothetical protein